MSAIKDRFSEILKAVAPRGHVGKHGRKEGFGLLRKLVIERGIREPVVVETGTLRNEAVSYVDGDGWSTVFFRKLIDELGGELHSVDIDPNAVAVSKRVIAREFGDLTRTFHYACDSVGFLRDFKKTIDILYLDSMNYTGDDSSARHQLAEIEACIDKVTPPGIIMVDDISETVAHGKAALSIPLLKKHGWTELLLIPVVARHQKKWFQGIITRPSPAHQASSTS
jgi:hypothetical protein